MKNSLRRSSALPLFRSSALPLFRSIVFLLGCVASVGFSEGQSLNEVRILETDLIASEGEPAAPARVTLVRTGSTASSLAVNLLIGGTATPGADYPAIQSPVIIPAGQTHHGIVISPYGDSLPEGDETINVTIDTGIDYTLASGGPTGTTVVVKDTPFDAWRYQHFTPGQLADAEISGPSADPDNDRNPNLGEFFAGSDPLVFDLGPALHLVDTDGLRHLSIRRNPAASALSILIERSDTLSGWAPLNPQPAMNMENMDGWDYLNFPIPNPGTGEVRRFWRARVSEAQGVIYDYYVDAINGSDSNNGRSPASAFQTVTAVDAATASSRSASVGFARGQRHRPALVDTYGFTGRWGAYGEGHMPFFDCSLPVNAGNIIPHGTHANVYVVEVTHAVAPTFFGASKSANGPHFGLWWETGATGLLGQYLLPVYSQTTTANAEAFVRDNPGSCFVQKVGSSVTDARDETSGSTFRYTFRLADSSDPRSGGSLRYACYRAVRFIWNPGAQISDLAFGRCTGKDQTGVLVQNSDPLIALTTFRRCAWLDTGCHASVGASNWYNCIAYSRTNSRNNGSGGWHNFTGVFEQRIPVCEDSLISGYFNGVYSHGVGQNPVMKSLQGRRLHIDNCSTALTFPTTSVVPIFEDIKLTNCDALMNQNGILRRFTAQIKAIGLGERRELFQSFNAPAGTLEDGVVKFPQTAECYITPFAPAQANAEALGTPTMRRVTVTPYNSQAGLNASTQRYINYVFDSVVGIRTVSTTDPNSTSLLFDATMTNSYIGPTKGGGGPLFATLAEYQAKVPGAANDVIMFDQTKPVTFAGDPLVNPTITGPAEILGKGMGVDPSIILSLPPKLSNIPTLQSMGFAP